MPEQRVTIEISKLAADCLATWAKMTDFYGPTISDTIVNQMEEWLNRENITRKPPTVVSYVRGEWDDLADEFKK